MKDKILATEEEIKDITSRAKHIINFGIHECFKCQYKVRCEECVYNEKDIGELIKSERQQAGKDMAKKILKEIRGYYPVDKSSCEKYEKFIIELCEDIAKQCGVNIEE